MKDYSLTYVGSNKIDGPLVVVGKTRDVGYDETAEVIGADGRPRGTGST